MGVRGLTTYINYNQKSLLETYYLHDTNLVIDGHSLCAQLYRSFNSFSAFGGDYDKFASHIRTFFKNLRKCKITAFVLFDGCHEKKKLRTVFSRLRSKLLSCSNLDPVTQNSLQIFPLFFRNVFIEILVEMNVRYTVCTFEADDEIASLARHLGCPVLSYDSDFFIYNVLYIPFNLLETKPTIIEENENKVLALECRIYKVQNLCEHFGLKEELLPLLAIMLGNDYVEKKVFKKFFSQLKLAKSKKVKNDQQRSIHSLFNWLQNETLDSAIEKILGRLKKNEKNKVFQIMKRGIDGYKNNECPSLKYFNVSEKVSLRYEFQMPVIDIEETQSDEETVSSDEESENNEEDIISDSNFDNIPTWLIEKIRHNQIPKVYLNLYVHNLQLCNPQAEDYRDNDSFLTALPIVRYAFDIITDFSRDTFVYVSRENCSYKKIPISKDIGVSRILDVSFKDLTQQQLQKCFYHFFNIKLPNLDWELLKQLPANVQLFMIAILWWLSNCSVPINHVHSLLMSYVMLEVIDEKTGTPRGHYYFKNKYGKKIEELKKNKMAEIRHELFLNKNKVQYEDCLIAANSLLQYFEIDNTILKKPKSYDIKRVHSFAQFQGILCHVNSLNILCGSPFQSTLISKCYNGTFIYNIALTLENQADPLKFLENNLNGATTIIHFYRSVHTLYEQFKEKMNLSTVVWSKRRRRRRKNGDDELTFIVKGFESDVKI